MTLFLPIRVLQRTIGILIACALVLLPGSLNAHPLGNFSVSHYSKLQIRDGSIEIRYFVDMAEIPTYQAMQQYQFRSDPGDAAFTAYLRHEGSALCEGLTLEIDGQRLPLRVLSSEAIFP